MNRFLSFKDTIPICLLVLLAGCSPGEEVMETGMFELLPPAETGIRFVNTVDESVELNIVTFEMIYNGAGVAVGDLNNDGYNDLFLASNMGKSRLFLNKGNFNFADITDVSGINTQGKWASGVTLVDINNSGYLDIYISFGGPYVEPARRANELYINNGDLTFTEMAADYGIADTGVTTQAVFFDYNKNGLLDLYLLTNGHGDTPPNVIRPKMLQGEHLNTDRLYRNNGDGTFTNVSEDAGILVEGYGLGINVFDINGNGWPDIHAANDFLPNDIVYINNKDGTFTDRAAVYFRHQSYASMGTDFGDINNDGWMDIITVDMLPESNKRIKQMYEGAGYDRFRSQLHIGNAPQFMRNVLQLNNGITPAGHPTFSDISHLAGVAGTDWSWSALFADFENNGRLDLMITNGIPRNPADNDFSQVKMDILRGGVFNSAVMERLYDALQDLDGVYETNYLFRNNGDLTFSDVSDSWGFQHPSYSTGAVYADLNNNGKLDLVINNINQEAFVYRNISENKNNFLKVKLNGSEHNRQGIGAKLKLFAGDKILHHQYSVSRGYLSAMAIPVHFGLGETTGADSLQIIWPDDSKQTVTALQINQTAEVSYNPSVAPFELPTVTEAEYKRNHVFTDVTSERNIQFTHTEQNFIDFKIQPLLPHKFSRSGPGIAVADVNGSGMDDFFIGGAFEQSGQIFIQHADGTFTSHELDAGPAYEKDAGALFFDANGDGKPDLYVASGGSEFSTGSQYYQDRFYLGDGKGGFTLQEHALPEMRTSTSAVVAADINRDGQKELFVGGRLLPNHYPATPESYILKFRDGKFVDITEQVAPSLKSVGMVTSAIWSDYNNNGWPDLIVVGEWMPVTVFENREGMLVNVTEERGLANTVGWWNSIAAGDFNQNGYMDYVAGNLGLNSAHKNSDEGNVQIHFDDLNGNGMMDPVMSRMMKGQRYPVHLRDELVMQIPEMARKFPNYESYGKATLDDLLTSRQMTEADSYEIHTFRTSIIQNNSGASFSLQPLPVEVQVAPVYGIITGDFDGDGSTDILMTGNSFSTDVFTGWYDAFSGLLLRGNGNGKFTPIHHSENGFYVDGDATALASVIGRDGNETVLAARNDGKLQAFEVHYPNGAKIVRAEAAETHAHIRYKNGGMQKAEFHNGSGYLSQSSGFVQITAQVEEIVFYDINGISRTIKNE